MSPHRVRFAGMEDDTDSSSESRPQSPSPPRGALHLMGFAAALPPLSPPTEQTSLAHMQPRSVRFAADGAGGSPTPSVASTSSSFGEPPSPPPKNKEKEQQYRELPGSAEAGAPFVGLAFYRLFHPSTVFWDVREEFQFQDTILDMPATTPKIDSLLLQINSPFPSTIRVVPGACATGFVRVRDVLAGIRSNLRGFVPREQTATLSAEDYRAVSAASTARHAEEKAKRPDVKEGIRRIDVLREATIFAGMLPRRTLESGAAGKVEPLLVAEINDALVLLGRGQHTPYEPICFYF